MKCVESLSFFLFAQLIAGRAVVEVVFGGQTFGRPAFTNQLRAPSIHMCIHMYTYVYA